MNCRLFSQLCTQHLKTHTFKSYCMAQLIFYTLHAIDQSSVGDFWNELPKFRMSILHVSPSWENLTISRSAQQVNRNSFGSCPLAPNFRFLAAVHADGRWTEVREYATVVPWFINNLSHVRPWLTVRRRGAGKNRLGKTARNGFLGFFYTRCSKYASQSIL